MVIQHIHVNLYAFKTHSANITAGMSKVHPEEDRKSRRDEPRPLPTPTPTSSSQQLTVWKRSSMSFQGSDGFTVFDKLGNLVFRVDNYSRRRTGSGTLLLMDGSGRALLTLKPQMLSIQHEWTAYRGEGHHCSRAFSMRRPSIFFPRKSTCEAEMFLTGEEAPDLKSHGSFRMRNCSITTTAATAQLVATISRKRINSTLLLTDDVFTLKVLPGFQSDLVMAFVIILDRICYKSNYAPILCS